MSPSRSEPSQKVRELLQRLGEKWTIALLLSLEERPCRYAELRRRLGLTSKVLTRTLRSLEADGLIARLESPVIRRQVDYELTPAGHSLLEFVTTFSQWFGRQPSESGGKDCAPFPAPPQAPSFVSGSITPVPDAGLGATLSLESVTLAVRSVDRSASAFSEVLGIPVPEIKDITIALPGDETARIRLCWFKLPNFAIGLAQHLGGDTPHREFIKRYGEGIHHLGFRTGANLQDVVDLLQQKGGKWRVGGTNVPYAHLDFREQMGTTLGISGGRPKYLAAKAEYRTAPPDALGRQRLAHIGIIVRDIEETARAYADVLGLGVSSVRMVDLAPPEPSSVRGTAKIAYLRQRGVALKLIEPIGPSPLRDFMDQYGNAVHHIGFEVGRQFPAFLARLQQSGGIPVLGREYSGYALIDFRDRLGIALEMSGIPAQAGSADASDHVDRNSEPWVPTGTQSPSTKPAE